MTSYEVEEGMFKLPEMEQCRVCLDNIRFYKYFSDDFGVAAEFVNGKTDAVTEIHETIYSAFRFCTRVVLPQEIDLHSQILCLSCTKSLRFAYDFIRRAKDSDAFLKNVQITIEEDYIVGPSVDEIQEDNEDTYPAVDSEYEDYTDAVEEVQLVEEVKTEIAMEEFEEEIENENLDIEIQVHDIEEEVSALVAVAQDLIDPTETFEEMIVPEVKPKLEPIDEQERKRLKNERIKNLPKTFLCDECPKSFNQNCVLRAHKKKVHSKEPKEKKLSCELCDKKFYNKIAVTRHIKTVHRSGLDFPCNICLKAFRHKECLVRHSRIHDGRKFECSICGKTYVRRHDLDVHNRLHTNERPFQCEHCPETFQLRVRLTNHINKVHLKKMYTCRYCESFQSKDDTTVRRHESEHFKYAYQCAECSKEFSQRNRFVHHTKTHHNFVLSEVELQEMYNINRNEAKKLEMEYLQKKQMGESLRLMQVEFDVDDFDSMEV